MTGEVRVTLSPTLTLSYLGGKVTDVIGILLCSNSILSFPLQISSLYCILWNGHLVVLKSHVLLYHFAKVLNPPNLHLNPLYILVTLLLSPHPLPPTRPKDLKTTTDYICSYFPYNLSNQDYWNSVSHHHFDTPNLSGHPNYLVRPKTLEEKWGRFPPHLRPSPVWIVLVDLYSKWKMKTSLYLL